MRLNYKSQAKGQVQTFPCIASLPGLAFSWPTSWGSPLIAVKCSSDGTLHYADDNLVGKTIRCRTCGVTLKIESPDQSSSIATKPEPIDASADRAVPVGAPRDPGTNSAVSGKAARWGYILGGAGLGVGMFLLFLVSWENNPSSVSTQIQTGSSPSVSEHSRESSSGSRAPSAVRHAPSVEPVRAKTGAEGSVNGTLPPCAQGREPSRLRTGERIEPDGEMSGQSNIRIVNASDLDVVVRLVDSVTGKTSRFVYVQAENSFAMEGIEAGAYMVRFQYGKDWIPECNGFIRDCVYGEFSDPFVFFDDRIRFYTVTLSPSIGGRSRTRRIDRTKFLDGDQSTRNYP